MKEPLLINANGSEVLIDWANPDTKKLVSLARSGVPISTQGGMATTPPIAVDYDTQTVYVGK